MDDTVRVGDRMVKREEEESRTASESVSQTAE